MVDLERVKCKLSMFIIVSKFLIYKVNQLRVRPLKVEQCLNIHCSFGFITPFGYLCEV